METLDSVYWLPLLELVYKAASLHRTFFDPRKIEICELLSIKTGGCTEDCAYCAQSSKHKTGLPLEKLMDVEEVERQAKAAKDRGATRFCMGAAWPRVRSGPFFDRVLEMVRRVHALALEPCVTLGMLTYEEACRLKEAGCHSYNHNLDTSESFYPSIITTRTYQDRIDTIKAVQKAGLHVCCGGIIGLGESHQDRIDLLKTLASFTPPPDSVPINALIPFPGTPLASRPRVSAWEILRMVATARIALPTSRIRLSAGRLEMSGAEQALCFLAGANSIHSSGKLLTASTYTAESDHALLELLGLIPEKEEKNCAQLDPFQELN